MLIITLMWTLFASIVHASFGYTDKGTYWTIDNGRNLVIEVSKTNGDIQSMKYNVSMIQHTTCTHCVIVLINSNYRVSSITAIITRTLK